MKSFLLVAAIVSAANALTNLSIKKITVQVGPDGTDENVRIKICDRSKCCQTNKLSHLLSSEWVKNQLEVWDGRKLGNCSTILFDPEEPGLNVAIIKENKKQDTLDVATIILEGAPINAKRDIIRFTCGSYLFGGRDTEKSGYCLSNRSSQGAQGPIAAVNLNINKITVQVGADGTEEKVLMEICDGSKCCQTKKLSHLLSSEWVPNQLETWDGGKLGNCSSILLDSQALGLDVSVIKTIKKQDTLSITSILLEGAPSTDKTKIIRFACGSFKFGKNDVKKHQYCRSTSPPATTRRPTATTKKPTITKRPTATTRRPTATTRRPTATTKRPSIGSNENLKLSNIIVQMGDDGTNDDVSMKICHANNNKCCETGNLDAGILSDDWSRNDREIWKNKNLGVCKNLHWDGCKGLAITLKKKPSKDTLKVSNITIELTDKINAKKTERFTCTSYVFLPTDKEKKNTCILDRSSSLSCRTTTRATTRTTTRRTGITTRRTTRRTGITQKSTSIPRVTIKPLFPNKENIVINKFEVEIGKDGTRDPVTVKVCAGRTCCTTPPLTKLPLNNSWKRNTNETWTTSDLGECRDKSLPTSIRKTLTNLQETQLTVTIQRRGRDGLKINNLNIGAQTSSGADRRFKCGKITVTNESESKDCFWQGIAPVPNRQTGSGPCLRSGRNCAPTKQTTRPPFRSGK